ncbi:MAG: hypothetical protein IJI14_18650 [Anaerolineaceae bacterium]|nr:hypothetical protein [Anaerolineaceae bacterium]
MKKLIPFFITLACLFGIFSGAFAFQSIFDRVNNLNTGEDASSEIDNDIPNGTRTEGFIRVDSIESPGETNSGLESLFQALGGLRIDYSSQNDPVPMASFSLGMSDFPIFSYSLQSTEPYFISSNLLGNKQFMIYDEDKFEEKCVDAVYRMVETSGSNSELPDINEVYAIIQSFRDGGIDASSLLPQQSAELTQKIDTSAFQVLLMNMMMKFSESEPTDRNHYFYTETSQESMKFDWPAPDTLPAFPESTSAITGTFTQQDLLDILNTFTRFLAANPELKDVINQGITSYLSRTNPEINEIQDADLITQFVSSLQNSVETNMEGFTLTLKIDMGKYGDPILFTVRLNDQSLKDASDTFIYILMNNNFDGSVFEAAIDSIQGELKSTLFRGIVFSRINEAETAETNLNFYVDSGNSSVFEYMQHNEKYTASTMTEVSNTDFSFDMNGEQGIGQMISTGIPNTYGGKDNTTQITYTHFSQGTPLFTAALTSESKTTDAKPGITASDAIAASQMNDSDYDQLVSGFFTNIVMFAMLFQ